VQKAFEYEVRYGRDGKPAQRRWSVGPVLIVGVIMLILVLTGHAVPAFLWSLLK
jgi:hypothetical protein